MSVTYTLVIGNKNLSSWSLRPWLALKMAGLGFAEVKIRLDQPETRASIKTQTPAGKVPVLKIETGGAIRTIWDSLAICEFIAEAHPQAGLWPEDVFTRAEARSYAAEMHSGFPDLRNQLSMDFARILPAPDLSEATQSQIARILQAWESALSRHQGAFLFGRFSIADCMYAPVVSRFRTFAIAMPAASAAYCERMMGLEAMREWMEGARAEIDAGWK